MDIFWITKSGTRISIRKMTTEHLINTIKYIDNLASNGLLIQSGSWGYDTDDMEYNEWMLYGKDVYKQFAPKYEVMNNELEKRKSRQD